MIAKQRIAEMIREVFSVLPSEKKGFHLAMRFESDDRFLLYYLSPNGTSIALTKDPIEEDFFSTKLVTEAYKEKFGKLPKVKPLGQRALREIEATARDIAFLYATAPRSVYRMDDAFTPYEVDDAIGHFLTIDVGKMSSFMNEMVWSAYYTKDDEVVLNDCIMLFGNFPNHKEVTFDEVQHTLMTLFLIDIQPKKVAPIPTKAPKDEPKNILSLKWGSLKSYQFEKKEALALIEELERINTSEKRQKEIICQLIDLCDVDTIYLHWQGEYVPKKEAKQYVMDYDTPRE